MYFTEGWEKESASYSGNGIAHCMIDMLAVPLEEVMGKQRLVPVGSSLMDSAVAVGTSFGVREVG